MVYIYIFEFIVLNIMDRTPTAIIYIGGHGAKVEKDGPVQTRSSVPQGLLNNVHHYSPVGNERVGVESGELMKKSILTNTSIIPSLFVYLLRRVRVPLREFLLRFIKPSDQLDKEAKVYYKSDPSERFQNNSPVDNKSLWFISMGEHRRTGEDDEPTSLSRMAAGDPIHFPLGVWCVLVHDADGDVPKHYIPNVYTPINIEPRLFHPEMLEYTINHNCDRIAMESKLHEFKNKDGLIGLLGKKGFPITDFIDPFKRSETPDARKYFNDLNITNSKSIPILQEIIAENIDRATERISTARQGYAESDQNDLWLIENSEIIKDAQMHAALTKHSTLYDIIRICKALLPPGTNIQIIDTTCSSDYARQPPLFGVLTGYNPYEDSQRIYESLPRTLTASSSSLSSSGSASPASPASPAELSARPSWREYFTEYVGGWFNLWFPRRQRTPSPPGDFTGAPAAPSPRKPFGGSRKSHKKTKNRIKSKRKARSTKKKTQKIRRHRK